MEVIIKRSKLRTGYLMDSNGCGCFTGHVLKAKGFLDQELIGVASPANVAARVGSLRGLDKLVDKGYTGYANTDATSALMSINDSHCGYTRERMLTEKAREIDVQATFVD